MLPIEDRPDSRSKTDMLSSETRPALDGRLEVGPPSPRTHYFAGGCDTVQMLLMHVMPCCAPQQSLVVVHLS